jgi:20S proteasome subunit beta 5
MISFIFVSVYLLAVYYVDSEGVCVPGPYFAVGSGGGLAYAILDSERESFPTMSLDDAVQLAMSTVRYAAKRDAYSGGIINVFHVNSTGCHHILSKPSQHIT